MKPRLIVHQKITAFVNKYVVYQANEDGSTGNMVAFAQQKRFNIKEKFMFYTDESKTQLAFTMRAEKVLDIHGKFLVEDPNGQLLGAFRKDFGKSLMKSTWHVLDSAGNDIMTISESNAFVAAMRRFGGIFSDLIDLIMLFIKYHFRFEANGTEIGRYKKTTLFRDHYELSFDDSYANTDWRLIAAVSVALDALQSR